MKGPLEGNGAGSEQFWQDANLVVLAFSSDTRYWENGEEKRTGEVIANMTVTRQDVYFHSEEQKYYDHASRAITQGINFEFKDNEEMRTNHNANPEPYLDYNEYGNDPNHAKEAPTKLQREKKGAFLSQIVPVMLHLAFDPLLKQLRFSSTILVIAYTQHASLHLLKQIMT